jgi:hypothetical protein
MSDFELLVNAVANHVLQMKGLGVEPCTSISSLVGAVQENIKKREQQVREFAAEPSGPPPF